MNACSLDREGRVVGISGWSLSVMEIKKTFVFGICGEKIELNFTPRWIALVRVNHGSYHKLSYLWAKAQ